VHLAGHCGLLLITGLAVSLARGTPWVALCTLVHGAILVFLFAPLHESIHKSAFRARWLNVLVSWIAGFLLLLPPLRFRCFHFAHHAYTQDLNCDPELATPKPGTLRQYLVHVSGLPYWFEQVAALLRHAAGRVREPYIGPRLRGRVTREARSFLLGYVVLAGVSWWFQSAAILTLWVFPALVGQPLLRLYLLAEHTGCPLESDMLRNSRTTRTNRFVRWLTWNMPYHAEHHACPSVPFHALPALNRIIGDEVVVRADGYVAVHREIVDALR
jgi:fatty acid desaturase